MKAVVACQRQAAGRFEARRHLKHSGSQLPGLSFQGFRVSRVSFGVSGFGLLGL